MYPLLRSLEAQGLAAGEWEHPERRSRRFYRITDAGVAERDRLAAELGAAAGPDRALDRRDPRRGAGLMGRASAVDRRARPRLRGRGALVRPGPLGRPGSTASATSSRCPRAGPPRAALRWNCAPGGPRARARDGDRLRAARRPVARGRGQPPARHPAGRVHARPRRASRSRSRSSTSSRSAPRSRRSSTASSCAARSPRRCAGRSPASPASGAEIWSWRPRRAARVLRACSCSRPRSSAPA